MCYLDLLMEAEWCLITVNWKIGKKTVLLGITSYNVTRKMRRSQVWSKSYNCTLRKICRSGLTSFYRKMFRCSYKKLLCCYVI